MKIVNKLILAAALAAVGAIPTVSPAADAAAQAPDAARREQIREDCKSEPEKCRAEMKQWAEAWFKKVDADGDGTINRAEAKANAPHLSQQFDSIDIDDSGTISRDELRTARIAAHERRREPGGGPSKLQ